MDRAAEQLIMETILAARPDDGMVGEEGASKASQSGISWLIDPIDGTTNYLRGIPNFSVSIAAVTEGETVIGVVYDPTLGETFTAIRNQGAALNDAPIAECDQADGQLIIASAPTVTAGLRQILREKPWDSQ
jgi:myo-inositol-1(or 4)-monophosphatase